jgi:hypothetical protein
MPCSLSFAKPAPKRLGAGVLLPRGSAEVGSNWHLASQFSKLCQFTRVGGRETHGYVGCGTFYTCFV